MIAIKWRKRCFQSLRSCVSNGFLQRKVCSRDLCISMASHVRKWLQRILHLKEPFTRSSRASRIEGSLQRRRLLDIPECPASARAFSSWGISSGIMWWLVQKCSKLAAGGVMPQQGPDFWTTTWCQEGQKITHFSLIKTSNIDWTSAGRTRIGQQKTFAKSMSLMKHPSDCLEHLENRLSREENVNATMSPVSCQQWDYQWEYQIDPKPIIDNRNCII